MLSLAGIVGQPHAVEFLRSAIGSGRLGHGYFFHGPSGVGKKTAAVAFAAALNCEAPPSPGEVCGSCTPCREISAGIYPELSIAGPEGGEGRERSFHIEQVAAAARRAAQTAHAGRTKVFILDDVHLMSEEAANRLLKILEEPPDRTVWILISPEPARVIPTLKSRCQQVRFSLLARAALSKLDPAFSEASAPASKDGGLRCLGQADASREDIGAAVAEAERFMEMARVMDLAGLSVEAQKHSRKDGNPARLLDGLERVCGAGLAGNPGSPDVWISALDAVSLARTRMSRHADRTMVEALGVELAYAFKAEKNG